MYALPSGSSSSTVTSLSTENEKIEEKILTLHPPKTRLKWIKQK